METLGHKINDASEISCVEMLVYRYTSIDRVVNQVLMSLEIPTWNE